MWPQGGQVWRRVNFFRTGHTTKVIIELDSIIEILKDELKGSQIKELKSILASNESSDEKKKTFVEKIKPSSLWAT